MKTLNEIETAINRLEASLRKRVVPVGINDPNWHEMVKIAAQLDPVQQDMVKQLRQQVIEFLRISDTQTQSSLKKIFQSNLGVIDHMHFSIAELASTKGETTIAILRDEFLLVAFLGLLPDARDVLLGLKEIVMFAEKRNINYKQLIEDVLPLACTDTFGGFGSMKKVLENYCSTYKQ